MKLQALKPRLTPLNTNRIKVLDTKAGATERVRGSAWMKVRHAVLLRDQYRCQSCGLVRMDNEVDHTVPLEKGGDALSMGNLKTLCGGPDGCHTRKTAEENKARTGRARG
ncbi:5-methylcytosine-specific restriction enzyme A [Polaromonas sp. OV174]|uniref:HNH endonuclease n=1 Tax=Polaromonas sp. OV174 TaxID=1855300 RepID=UPI0008EE615E|nr:HNH endonuclease [Polaromonas sp. OV174]SFB74321.1 5-methylcytosine-specific restriction enzyme A [Polaromonas sp. OV174]